MNPRTVAWVLNLDADLELAAGRGYSPSKAVLAAMAPQQARLKELLGAALVGDSAVGAGSIGRAFCPTPRAIAAMRAAGVEPEPYPDFEVLRRVNGRQFCAALGQTLPGAELVTSLSDALAVLAKPPPIGRQWRAKRVFGMAGRGQRPIAAGEVAEADVAFLRTSIDREGGIQLEPELPIVREVAMHGLVAPTGELRLGPVVEQTCDASGQWQSSRATGESIPSLAAEARRVAEALAAASYFGPFGLDAFFYAASGGSEVHLQPRSEINARYSMGYPASGLLLAPVTGARE